MQHQPVDVAEKDQVAAAAEHQPRAAQLAGAGGLHELRERGDAQVARGSGGQAEGVEAVERDALLQSVHEALPAAMGKMRS